MTNNYFDTINWIPVNIYSEAGITVEEFISEDRKYIKQIWNDGYKEIHEIG